MKEESYPQAVHNSVDKYEKPLLYKAQPAHRVFKAEDLPDAPFHIVLVEPQIPPNTGNAARLCAATGCALHLVEPLGFSIGDRALKRAGLDYWDKLAVALHPSLEHVLKHFGERIWLFSTRAKHRYDKAPYHRGDALIFGKETSGLPERILQQYQERCVRIPMLANQVRSLNLSTAVGIATYRALANLNFPDFM